MKDKTPLERAQVLATTPLFENIHAETASSALNQTAPKIDTDLHFTCFVEAPEAEFRWIARERDGEGTGEDIEKEREEAARGSGTGIRVVELDGRREGPIDHGECKDLLKVSCPFSLGDSLRDSSIDEKIIGCSQHYQNSIYSRLDEFQL